MFTSSIVMCKIQYSLYHFEWVRYFYFPWPGDPLLLILILTKLLWCKITTIHGKIMEWANLAIRIPFAIFYPPITSFIISCRYTFCSFANLFLPSNWFRLTHSLIFYPTKIFPHMVDWTSTISWKVSECYINPSNCALYDYNILKALQSLGL